MTAKDEERLWEVFKDAIIIRKMNVEDAFHASKQVIDYFNSQTKVEKDKKPLINNINEREAAFRLKCDGYIKLYSKQMIDAFFLYWSERSQSGTKMRWEIEKTFDIERRLLTWASRDRNFVKPQYRAETRKPDPEYEAFKKRQ